GASRGPDDLLPRDHRGPPGALWAWRLLHSGVRVPGVLGPMHLLDRIDRWADLAPDRCAHRSGERTLTYAELRVQSDLLAAWIEGNLGDDRSPIAVHGHKEPEMLVAFLAAAK